MLEEAERIGQMRRVAGTHPSHGPEHCQELREGRGAQPPAPAVASSLAKGRGAVEGVQSKPYSMSSCSSALGSAASLGSITDGTPSFPVWFPKGKKVTQYWVVWSPPYFFPCAGLE